MPGLSGASSTPSPVISGTPAQSGSFSFSVQGFNTPGGTGMTNGVLVPITFTIAAGATVPALTTHPAAQTVNVGSTVTFSAAASGTPAPTFQWRKNGANLAGAIAASLTLTNVQTSDAGTYTVVASNSAGTASSNAATLIVNVPTSVPTVFQHPVGQSALLGETVSFTAGALARRLQPSMAEKRGQPSGATAPR